ncbi:hypothetical protein D3C85_1377120 [compost metagenome]
MLAEATATSRRAPSFNTDASRSAISRVGQFTMCTVRLKYSSSCALGSEPRKASVPAVRASKTASSFKLVAEAGGKMTVTPRNGLLPFASVRPIKRATTVRPMTSENEPPCMRSAVPRLKPLANSSLGSYPWTFVACDMSDSFITCFLVYDDAERERLLTHNSHLNTHGKATLRGWLKSHRGNPGACLPT